MKKLFKRGLSAFSAAALAASMAAVMPMSASADSIPDSTAQFLQDLGAGWVLGNTFDATNSSTNTNGTGLETSWQPDKTTEAAIKAVHAAGFNTIRIPVSWHNHMADDYTINEAWMARVHEVVDWAYNDGMYVIINIHHDNLTSSTASKKFGFYPDSAHKEGSTAFVNAVWSQLADEYSDYGDHLIFETLNEPRLAGTSYEWYVDANTQNTTVKDACTTVDDLNQSAVNTIRAKGGNNATRYIICPGYVASINGATRATMPSDPGNSGKIIRSIHCYDPYDFCLGSDTDHTSAKATIFSDSYKSSLKYSFNAYKSLVDKGIPVIIDEMGVSDKENDTSRAKWAAEAFRLAKEYNTPCVLWDNNASFTSTTAKGWSEHHRHLNRKNGKWVDPTVISAIMDSAGVTDRTITADDSVVEKQPQTVNVSTTSYTKNYGDPNFTISATCSSGGAVSFSSSKTNVATVNSSGVVTIRGLGTTTITVTAPENKNYLPATKDITLTVNPRSITPSIDPIPDQKYTGSAIEPAVTVYDGKTKIAGSFYDVTYKNNVNPGTATVTVTMKTRYVGSKDFTFKIVGDAVKPGDVTIKSVSTGAGAAKLSWKSASNATGYEVSRLDDSTNKFVVVGTTDSLSFKETGLKAAKLYTYRVRAFNKSNNTTAWGNYSAETKALTKPKNTKITKIAKTRNSVKLTWKKVSCTGYQVQKYDTAKKKWVTVKTVKGAKKTSFKITKLKKNTAYKFRVRAYKKTSGLKSCSAWAKKTVRTKK